MTSIPLDSEIVVYGTKPHTVASLKRATAELIAQAKREEKKAKALATAAAKYKMAMRRLAEAAARSGEVQLAITADIGPRW